VDSKKVSDEFVALNIGDTTDRGNVFKEHEACWRLDKRGALGETGLHLCILFSATWPEFNSIANALLEAYPKLALDYYEGAEYYGKWRGVVLVRRLCST